MVTIRDGGGSSNGRNFGIVSTNGFGSPLGLLATWDVSSYDLTLTSGVRRLQFMLQSGTGFNSGGNTRSMRVEINPVSNDMVLHIRDGVHANQTFTQDLTSIIVLDNDGFTLTASFNQDGYSITTSGLNASVQGNITGTYPTTNGLTYDSLFGAGNMHAAAYVFSGNSTGTLVIDQITLAVIVPEPPGFALGFLALAGLGCAAQRNRRRGGKVAHGEFRMAKGKW